MHGDTEQEAPVASGLLLPPQDGAARYGRDSRFAELVLDIEPRRPQGGQPEPANLAAWHERFVRVLKLPALFEHFLAHELLTNWAWPRLTTRRRRSESGSGRP